VLALLLSAFQAAPEGKPDADAPDGAIVVTASRGDLVEAYIDALTRTRSDRQIARWNGHVCPRAIGLDAAHNAYLASRVAEIARAAGVPVERGACMPNILIVMTGEADRFVAMLLDKHPLLFGGEGGRPPAAVAQALRGQRPVRWVHAGAWGNADGRPLDGRNNFIFSASRLQASTRRNAMLSILVVDATRLQHITWRAFSAYLGMVAVALPPPDLEAPEGNTILSLFEPGDAARATDLTRWDRAYLKSLYGSGAAGPAAVERRAMAQSVHRALGLPAAASAKKKAAPAGAASN
jgi:hypothetical protein